MKCKPKKNIPMTLMSLGPVVIVLSLSHGGVSGGMDVAVTVVSSSSCLSLCGGVSGVDVWLLLSYTHPSMCTNTGKCRSGAEVIDGRVYIVVVK